MDTHKCCARNGLQLHAQLPPQARVGEQAQLLLLRTDDVMQEMARRLPQAFRRAALLHDSKSPVMCLVICNNKSEAELAKARDPDILKMFHDIVGSEQRLRWYPVTYRMIFNLRTDV